MVLRRTNTPESIFSLAQRAIRSSKQGKINLGIESAEVAGNVSQLIDLILIFEFQQKQKLHPQPAIAGRETAEEAGVVELSEYYNYDEETRIMKMELPHNNSFALLNVAGNLIKKLFINSFVAKGEIEIGRSQVEVYAYFPDAPANGQVRDNQEEVAAQAVTANILSVICKHYGFENAVYSINAGEAKLPFVPAETPCVFVEKKAYDLIAKQEQLGLGNQKN